MGSVWVCYFVSQKRTFPRIVELNHATLFCTLSLRVSFSLIKALQFSSHCWSDSPLRRKGFISVMYLKGRYSVGKFLSCISEDFTFYSGSSRCYLIITLIFRRGICELWVVYLPIRCWGHLRLLALNKVFPYGHHPNFSYWSMKLPWH